LKQNLEHVELMRRQRGEIHEALAMKEHTATLVRITNIPGVDLAAVQELLAEIGATFATAEQFASLEGCPGSQEPAGVCYSHRSATGNRSLRRLLCQIAWAATHTKDTFLAGLFERLKPWLGRCLFGEDEKGGRWKEFGGAQSVCGSQCPHSRTVIPG
jgi:transposase